MTGARDPDDVDEAGIAMTYITAFEQPHLWTPKDHLAGLRAVWAAAKEPAVIDTLEELTALPSASIVLDENDDVYQVAGEPLDDRDWGCMSPIGELTFTDPELLAEHPRLRLLYRPKGS